MKPVVDDSGLLESAAGTSRKSGLGFYSLGKRKKRKEGLELIPSPSFGIPIVPIEF